MTRIIKHSDKVLRARARLLLKSAFFGTVLVSTPMVVVPGLGTAATDMRTIAYDPDFFESISLEQVIGVMAHEVLHIVLKHGLRRQGRDPKLWNIACDYAINLMLIECGFELPKGGLFDAVYRGMSAEQIYDLLLKHSKPKGGRGKGQPGQDGVTTKDSGIPGVGEDLLEPGTIQPDGKVGDKDSALGGPEDIRALEQELSSKIAQATTMGRMAGKMPASLLRAIDQLLHPPVPWQELMRPMVRVLVKHDESWMRRNRRFSSVYLPSSYSTRVGKVVLIGDTSGSIGNDDLRKIGGSVVDIAEEVQPESIHVLWADTRVAGEQVFDRGDSIELVPEGGGGTDMRVPLARAAELEPDIVVLVTDGLTPWPDSVDYPLIVVCTTTAPVPVGEVVRI